MYKVNCHILWMTSYRKRFIEDTAKLWNTLKIVKLLKALSVAK